MSEKLISLNEAAAQGIDRVRMPKWANPADYLKIDIIDGKLGPWGHLYSPSNEEINGRNPVDMLIFQDSDKKAFVPAPTEKDEA